MKASKNFRQLLRESWKRGYRKAINESYGNSKAYANNFLQNYIIRDFSLILRQIFRTYSEDIKTYEDYCDVIFEKIQDSNSRIISAIQDYFVEECNIAALEYGKGSKNAITNFMYVLYDILYGKYCSLEDAMKVTAGGRRDGVSNTVMNMFREYKQCTLKSFDDITMKDIEKLPLFKDFVDDVLCSVNDTIAFTIDWESDAHLPNKLKSIKDIDLGDLDYQIRKLIWQMLFQRSARYKTKFKVTPFSK